MQKCPTPVTLERAFLCLNDMACDPAMQGISAGAKAMEITQYISRTLRNKWKE
jgi:hypothetical protein